MARSVFHMKERLWWLDVVYPLALAALLFTSLTYIVYSGPRQSRLSLAGERKLLEFSLSQSTPERTDDRGVLVVSADPLDVARLGRAPRGLSPDASAAVYARVLTRLAEGGVPLVVLLWDTEAHPSDEVYYLPLSEALRHIAGTTRVYLATPPETYEQLPAAVRQLALRADNGPCSEDSVNIECTYLPDYTDWLAQKLLGELGVVRSEAPATALPWLSTQLSSVYLRYILNLRAPQSLATLSFRDVLRPAAPDALRGVRVAFVGADQGGAISGVGASTYTRHVLTVFDDPHTNVEVAGTPLHVFWAMVGQMFLGKSLVNVPPGWAISATAAVFCLLIILAMSLFGGPAALGMFLVVAGCGPFVNALGIKHFSVYLPLFDSYYFGLSTFLAAGLGRLSVTAYHRWRLEAERRLHAHAADLKGNFISLLSHNLNTPVAKMQGMLAVLSAQPAAAPWAGELGQADALVAQLEQSIRCVLLASALEEGSVNDTPRTTLALSEEFAVAVAPGLRRLGVAVTVEPPEADDDGLLLMPLAFDVRALTTAVGALSALLRLPDRRAPVHVAFGVKEVADTVCLVVTLIAPHSWLPESAVRTLADTSAVRPGALRALRGESFFCDVLTGLAMLVIRQYKGTIAYELEPPGGCVTVTLVPTPQATTERLA